MHAVGSTLQQIHRNALHKKAQISYNIQDSC